MPLYQPQINSAEQVAAELQTAYRRFAAAASDVFSDEFFIDAKRTVDDPAFSATYDRYLPYVQRFIIAELDTDAPSKRGIGRLADGDPPPRLGSKFRKQLRNDDAQGEVGHAAERLVLSGFLSQAIFYDDDLEVRADLDYWPIWLRHLIPWYQDTTDLSTRARNEEQSNLGIIGAMTITLGDHGGSELMEAYERRGIYKGRAGSWRDARALSYFLLFMGAGRALFHVLSEKVDPDFGSLQSQELLESYAEKRNKRQMVAQNQQGS